MLMNQGYYSTKSRTSNFITLVDLFGISDKGRALVALAFYLLQTYQMLVYPTDI